MPLSVPFCIPSSQFGGSYTAKNVGMPITKSKKRSVPNKYVACFFDAQDIEILIMVTEESVFINKNTALTAVFFKYSVLAATYSCPCGLPSALMSLTSEFGMRSGVSPPLSHQNRIFKHDELWQLHRIQTLKSTPFLSRKERVVERVRT